MWGACGGARRRRAVKAIDTFAARTADKGTDGCYLAAQSLSDSDRCGSPAPCMEVLFAARAFFFFSTGTSRLGVSRSLCGLLRAPASLRKYRLSLTSYRRAHEYRANQLLARPGI